MKYTLLDMTQSIASSMDSDEINSINDSVESLQIANVIRSAYFDIISRANLPEHYTIVTLDAYTDNTKPIFMTVPETVSKIVWLKYNKTETAADNPNMQLITYLTLSQFLDRMQSIDPDGVDVDTFDHTVGSDTFKFVYYTDTQPSYYTTFDDNTVVFDSFDSAIDTTLQKSKTQCYGKSVIPFTMADSFTPDLDEDQFPLLLNEAKSLAWLELKQSPHLIAERNIKRNWSHVQKNKYRTETLSDFEKLPNFGRK
jgi:hypothetical protein